MPRHSEKFYAHKETQELFEMKLVETGGFTQEAMQWLFVHKSLKEQHLYPRIIPKSTWATNILPRLSDTRFRRVLRMDRHSFQHVLQLIQTDPIFENESNISQAPVEDQLHYALYKLGHDGSLASYGACATNWDVSEGHIYNCTRRVVEALFNLQDQLITWPNSRKQLHESMVNDEREGFIGAVGKVDGTDIILKFKPSGHFKGELFFTRKKRYAMDICAVCDSSKKFTYVLAGWPNSQHDARIFASTNIQRNLENYLLPGEYLSGDSAYLNTSHMVTPYKSPLALQPENRRFNRKLSKIRIDIEHAFGMLNGLWASLTGLRVLILSLDQYKFAVKCGIACCVLHNILLELNDEWLEKEGWWTSDEEENHEIELVSMTEQQEREGVVKREYIKQVVLGTK